MARTGHRGSGRGCSPVGSLKAVGAAESVPGPGSSVGRPWERVSTASEQGVTPGPKPPLRLPPPERGNDPAAAHRPRSSSCMPDWVDHNWHAWSEPSSETLAPPPGVSCPGIAKGPHRLRPAGTSDGPGPVPERLQDEARRVTRGPATFHPVSEAPPRSSILKSPVVELKSPSSLVFVRLLSHPQDWWRGAAGMRPPPVRRRTPFVLTWSGGGGTRSPADSAEGPRRGLVVPRGIADGHLDQLPAGTTPDLGPRRAAAGIVEGPVVRFGALHGARAPPAGEGGWPGDPSAAVDRPAAAPAGIDIVLVATGHAGHEHAAAVLVADDPGVAAALLQQQLARAGGAAESEPVVVRVVGGQLVQVVAGQRGARMGDEAQEVVGVAGGASRREDRQAGVGSVPDQGEEGGKGRVRLVHRAPPFGRGSGVSRRASVIHGLLVAADHLTAPKGPTCRDRAVRPSGGRSSVCQQLYAKP